MTDINFDEVNEIPLPPATDTGDIGTSTDDVLAAWDDPLPPAGSQYEPTKYMSDTNFDEVNEVPLPPAIDTGDIGTSADDPLAAWDDPLPPAGSQYDPSVGGVDYPNPEFMEGNYGGPERLG